MKRRRRRRRKKALKNTAEVLLGEEKERGQEKVMKSKIEDLKEKREAAHERRMTKRKKRRRRDEEEKKKTEGSVEEGKKPSEGFTRAEKDAENPGDGFYPEEDTLWNVCSTKEIRPSEMGNASLENEYVKVEDKVQGHIRKSDESMPVMYEDVENAFSRVREKESDIKTVEMKYREEMEMKQAELKMLKEVFVDAREEKPQVVKCKEVSTRLNEVLDTAIFAMKEIQEEMPKYNRLFLEEDPESEKRRLALSRVFKMARERVSVSEYSFFP
eukprot:s3519_g7.t1